MAGVNPVMPDYTSAPLPVKEAGCVIALLLRMLWKNVQQT